MFKLIEWVIDMLGLCEKRVNIGVNENACVTKRHGVLWLINEDDSVRRVGVLIDKPKQIENGLNYATWRRLKRQVDKMGFNATHLELLFHNGNHYCYRLDEYKELYAKDGKGTPLYELGVS